MIHVRFDKINDWNDSNKDELLGRYRLPAVPDIAELIYVPGEEYIVRDRSWAIDDETDELYCYIRLMKAS